MTNYNVWFPWKTGSKMNLLLVTCSWN